MYIFLSSLYIPKPLSCPTIISHTHTHTYVLTLYHFKVKYHIVHDLLKWPSLAPAACTKFFPSLSTQSSVLYELASLLTLVPTNLLVARFNEHFSYLSSLASLLYEIPPSFLNLSIPEINFKRESL